jgi:hypothetical protein
MPRGGLAFQADDVDNPRLIGRVNEMIKIMVIFYFII